MSKRINSLKAKFIKIDRYSFSMQLHQLTNADYFKTHSFNLTGRVSTLFVFAIYTFMVILALFCVIRYGRNIPLAEDWLLVAPLTGNEPDFMGWLWAQNNEHRVPLPKLVMLGLLKITNGDFRAGMFFNVFALGALALTIILFLRKMRGQTKFVDAFFPIILLHLGNWENMIWSWQLSFVLPTIMILVFFLITMQYPFLNKLSAAAATGIILVLLPFCGGNGLLFVPFLGLWLIYCGIYNWKTMADKKVRFKVSSILIISSLFACLLCIVYFIGYKRPTWNPINPGIVDSLITAAKFIALGIGPVAKFSWVISSLVTLIMLGWSIYIALTGLLNKSGTVEKQRALTLLLFFGILLIFALAIGWGRAGLVPQYGMPIRYVLFSSHILCMCFFAWELYGSKKMKRIFEACLLVIMIFLLPMNTKQGFQWRNWYVGGMKDIERDLSLGLSTTDLAKRHKPFLIHWWEDSKLADHMMMLRNADKSSLRK